VSGSGNYLVWQIFSNPPGGRGRLLNSSCSYALLLRQQIIQEVVRQRQVPLQMPPAHVLLVADQARPVAPYVRAKLGIEVCLGVVAVHGVAERFAARAALSLVAAQAADGLGGGGLGRPCQPHLLNIPHVLVENLHKKMRNPR
jgi:hypothetical protein